MAGTCNAARRDLLLALVLGAASVAAFLIYPVLDHGPDKIFLQTPLDRAIPLVPVMVIPYLSLNPVIILAAIVLAIAGPRRLQALAPAVTLALLVSHLSVSNTVMPARLARRRFAWLPTMGSPTRYLDSVITLQMGRVIVGLPVARVTDDFADPVGN